MSYYVYALVDPINNVPFYIGKGKGNRAFFHGKTYDKHNSRKLKTIKNINLLGFKHKVVFIQQNINSSKEALQLESNMIKLWNFNYPNFKLTNKDNVVPDRSGSKLSKTHIEVLRSKNKGKTLSEDHKKKIGVSNAHKPSNIVKNTQFLGAKEGRNEGSRNPRAISIIINGMTFGCKKDAYEYFNVSKQTFEKHYKYNMSKL